MVTKQNKMSEKMAFIFQVYQSACAFMQSICLLKIDNLSMLDTNEKP